MNSKRSNRSPLLTIIPDTRAFLQKQRCFLANNFFKKKLRQIASKDLLIRWKLFLLSLHNKSSWTTFLAAKRYLTENMTHLSASKSTRKHVSLANLPNKKTLMISWLNWSKNKFKRGKSGKNWLCSDKSKCSKTQANLSTNYHKVL